MEAKNWIIGTGILILLVALIGGLVYSDELIEDKLTYVSSTEYIAGDESQTIVRLTNFQGTQLSATCKDTILYPNKTIFLQDQPMTGDGFGNYYHTFTAPTQDGVYTTNVNCTYGSKTRTGSKTFHISLLNARTQARFDGLNLTLTNQHLQIINEINNTQNNLTQEIKDTRIRIETAQTDIQNQITNFESDVQSNVTTIINLINQLNQTETEEHADLVALLQYINATTTTTQTTLNTFRSETTNNFQIINDTILDVKTDTIQIISDIEIMYNETNQTLTQIKTDIENLQTSVDQNQEITLQNFSNIAQKIISLNNSVTTGFQNMNSTLISINTTIHYKLDVLNNITNLTEYEVRLILELLNISLDSLTIIPESNDCWVGGQWVMFAIVQNHFGVWQTNATVECNITTTNWGFSTMGFDTSRQKFKYTHYCDIAGSIDWTINCEYS